MSIIWITGLSGSGKTTLGKCLKESFLLENKNYLLLDGDELRKIFGLYEFNTINHSRENRLHLALKYAKLVKMLSDKNLNIIITTISMFKEIYKWNRENLNDYTLIYLKVGIETLRKRDPKEIYARYFNGDLKNVSGLDLKVDEPKDADLTLNCANLKSQILARKVLEHLKSKNYG